MPKNQKGFALATCLALLPVFAAMLIASYFVVASLNLDLEAKKICRENGIQTFKQVRPLLQILMGLNPAAQALKLRYEIAIGRVVFCTLQKYCLAQAMRELNRVKKLRSELDIKQKQIIQQANQILKLQNQRTLWELQNVLRNRQISIFKISKISVSGAAAKLSVRPTSSDVAPTYRTENQFTKKQSLAFQWQYVAQLTQVIKPLQGQGFKFQRNCAVSLKENQKWSIHTIEDKFLSKSRWSYY